MCGRDAELCERDEGCCSGQVQYLKKIAVILAGDTAGLCFEAV
jgi:hypothetical protein